MRDKSVPVLSALQRDQLHVIARARACALGLIGDDTDDCAIAFVEHLNRQIARHPQTILPHLASSSWILRSANNWAKNYARRYCQRPVPTHSARQAISLPTSSQTPETDATLLEPKQRLHAALRLLSPAQRNLFQRHCVTGETIAQIAETMYCPPDAIRRSYCELRRRLQDLLIQSGLDPREAMNCLYQALTSHS